MFPVSPDDYIAVTSETVMFDSCDKRICIEIEIVNDTFVEIAELFTVTVDTLHDRIMSDPAVAVVTITDNDCELTFYN